MWGWLTAVKEWFSAALDRVLGREEVQAISELRTSTASPEMSILVSGLASGQLDVGAWEASMREAIKAEYIQQYALGRGGLDNMTRQDWGSVGGMIADQYRYLDGFAGEVAAGNLSEAQIAMRSRMYINSAREAFWRARQRAKGWPKLPAYPGDGTTVCLTNCQCGWDARAVEDHWEATWYLGEAEHCTSPDMDAKFRPAGCMERAVLWNPLRLEANA